MRTNPDDRELLAPALDAGSGSVAVALGGSYLYGSAHTGSDLDAHLIMPSLPYGRTRPLHRMEGELDLWLFPLLGLTRMLALGRLRECETVWAIQAGHGTVLDPRWEPFLLALRPSLPTFVHIFQRTVDDPKHLIRLEIFTERALRTGNTDPRLSERELDEYRSALAATGCTADEHHRPLSGDESPYGKEGP